MNENLDLTKILKGCPKGTKLYSTIYGEVEFIRIDNKSIDYPIDFNTFDGYTISLTSDGRCNKSYDGECMLFPSKDKRDWSKWQRPFVDGDIVTFRDQLLIFKKYIAADFAECYVFLDSEGELDLDGGNYYVKKIATEEEKQKLFDAIKKNGYEWDAEKKELKKIEPKFDITTLQPFDKVLVRDSDDDIWIHTTFGYINEKTNYPFVCERSMSWKQCVPYNDETKHLIGTTDKAPSKYITWE